MAYKSKFSGHDIDNAIAKALTSVQPDDIKGFLNTTILSTWSGTTSINTLGTITKGTWNGSPITNSFIANNFINISGKVVNLGSSITQTELKTALGLGPNAFNSEPFVPSSEYTPTAILNKLKEVDGKNSGLDADMLGGYKYSDFLAKTAYACSNGYLIETDIPANSDTMVVFRIEGNGFGAVKNIFTIGSFYNNPNADNFSNYSTVTHYGLNFGDITLFRYNGNVCIWLQQFGAYNSYIVKVFATNKTGANNRVLSISNSAIPDTDVTAVTVVKAKNILDYFDGTLNIDISGTAAKAERLNKTILLWGRAFDGTESVSGDINEVKDIEMTGSIHFVNSKGVMGKSVINNKYELAFIPRENDYTYLNYGTNGFFIRLNDSTVVAYMNDVGNVEFRNKLTTKGDALFTANVTVNGEFTHPSAKSLKNIISTDGLSLEELTALKPVKFTWKDNRDNNIHVGGIADDVKTIIPEVVLEDNNGSLQMNYLTASYYISTSLIKYVLENNKKIIELEKELDYIKNKN